MSTEAPLWQIRLERLLLGIADDRKHREADGPAAYAQLVEGLANGRDYQTGVAILALDGAGKSVEDLERDVEAAAAKLHPVL